uniref:Ecotropic viral integration site 5 like n=1 Tax=Phasianus colchicus TaxID=9054 RepID=A0A669QG83_PHACC
MASPAVSPDSSSHEGLSSVNSAPACSPTSDSENLSPDELELLAKLEEQNRLLEADSKSMRSMNGSRRNSGSSLVSSSSASSNLSHLEEDTWILWGRIVNEWDEWRKKKEKLLKELIRKGIPHHFRAIVWQLLCSATDMPVKNQYSELLKMSSPCEKLIRRDIARTYPEHEFFKGQDSLGQEVLFNVMKAYSLVDREVGYCQGSAFIVGLLLMQMPEEEAFCVFVRLMQEYRLRELFKPSMAELGLCIYQFEYMLQEQLPELNIHFRSQSFLTSMYASSWFLTLFLTTFPLPVATRVFDIFMYEGLEIVFRVGMALLQFNQAELVQLDMEGMSQVRLGNSLLPDEDNVVRLQEELQALALREAEAVKSLTELQQQVKELSDSWQVRPPESPPGFLGPFTSAWGQIQRTVLGRAEQTCAGLREQLRLAAAQSKGLQAQLSESHRKHAEAQCKSKEEVMAVRLREADSMAALAEMRQRVAELEIQREEGMIQGQLNHSDAAQYIRQLKDHIDELKAEVRHPWVLWHRKGCTHRGCVPYRLCL